MMKTKIILFKFLFFIFFLGIFSSNVFAQEGLSAVPVAAAKALASLSSEDYVRKAWEASAHNNIEEVERLTDECVEIYGETAKKQQASLIGFPSKGFENDYAALNNVATALFIHAEILMKKGETEKAKEMFKKIANEFSWAQAWDPRGWFWSIAEKSQASIDKLEGRYEAKQAPKIYRGEKTKPVLNPPGTEKIINYKKYGHFVGIGTKDYEYVIDDPIGLMKAAGEGIYPNTGSILKDPQYRQFVKDGKLGGTQWDYVETDDLQRAFYKWATASVSPGEKLFYLGLIFEEAGMFYESLKAYRAIQIHFPAASAKTYWNTPWYPAQAAIAKVRHIVNTHPELNLKYVGAKIKIKGGTDNNLSNDVMITWPGELRKRTWLDTVQDKIFLRLPCGIRECKITDIKKKIGGNHVCLVQSKKSGHWQLLVDGKPFIIKGLTYSPTKVGESPDNGTLANWQTQDTNNNGLPDGPFDSWVDKNFNNKQDPDEPVIGDFQLLKAMGANTIRLYREPSAMPNRELLRTLYEKYGVMTIMSDFLGKYAIGSGASWFDGTDYENEEQKKTMMNNVRTMVEEFKDEPFILFWLLGNENNYGLGCNADKKPEAYYKFVEEVAQMIKSIDKNHPVAICNGDIIFLDIFAKYCPSVDIFGVNAYRGDYGFGSLWENVNDLAGKPAFITEYGCPAYTNYLDRVGSEEAQASYHNGAWNDIMFNAAGTKDGVGNALGGVVFEWTDEWWKNYEPSFHDKTAGAKGPFPDGFMYEEWFGIVGQGDGQHSPFLRQLRRSYDYYKGVWQ